MASQKTRRELTGVHVVVIDDNQDARTILKMVLEARGAFVMVAASARDGLALLKQISPDVLVVGLTMATKDGYWFIAQLKAQCREGGRTPPPAIAVGAQSGGDSEAAIRAGFDVFVHRPVDTVILCEAIERLANRSS